MKPDEKAERDIIEGRLRGERERKVNARTEMDKKEKIIR